MTQEFQYFYEDEVFRFNRRSQLQLGMVVENAEFVSSDEDSDTEEEEKVSKGSIRVAWYPKGEEQVLPERKVGLGDRSLMPGDVVRRLIKGKDTQRGYCRQVHVSASVQVIGTKFVIVNVNSNNLTPLEDFSTGIAVALDSWVGMVNIVKCKIVMVTSDGSKFTLSDHEALHLDDVRDPRDRGSEFRRYDFFPGQQLVGPSRVFEDVEWISKQKDKENFQKSQKLVKVTVDEVQVVQLGVRWQCRAFSNDPFLDKEQPKYIVQGDDLKRVRMLNVFEPCTLQLGDRNYYVMREGDVLLTWDQWRKLTAATLMADQTNPCPLRPRPSKHKNANNYVQGSHEVSLDRGSSGKNHGASGWNFSNFSHEENGLRETSDESDEFVDVDTDDFSDSASVSSEASTGSFGRRNKKGPALMTKVLKKRKLKRAKRKNTKTELPPIKPGDRLVVETLMTTSKADVVWQDGSVENDIPSTVLYPIHHLDDQEFFPGDFVVEQKDSVDTHEYGVVQRVDHGGRTAKVKWFHTYTAGSEPQPYYICEQEVSVYDLRDHPDFRYRPGSVVIRVANYENGQMCSTGQVLDNFPTGEVSVWWVDGTKSVCYPQDLYKVGEYDSDEGELWDDSASDESWETESEHSIIAEEIESENDNQLKTKLVANIEKARIAMSRLEEIFTQNPSLQTTAVMKQLLDCYKECRCMDKLMGTCFFHESNFEGLIEKVRERGRASTNQRMAEQFNRLFSAGSDNDGVSSSGGGTAVDKSETRTPDDAVIVDNHNKVIDGDVDIELVNHNPSKKDKIRSSLRADCVSVEYEDSVNNKDSNCNKTLDQKILDQNVPNGLNTMTKNDILKTSSNLCENLANLSLTSASESGHSRAKSERTRDSLRHKRMSETDMIHGSKQTPDANMKDSKSCGDLHSGTSHCPGPCCGSLPTRNMAEDLKTSHMCAQLCSLMKAQLLKTYEEVVCRYGGHFDMSLMQACQDSDLGTTDSKETMVDSSSYEILCEGGGKCSDNTGPKSPSQGENSLPNDVFKEPSNTGGTVDTPTVAPAGSGMVPTPTVQPDGFQVLEAAPDCHKFKLTMFQPTDPQHFYRTVRKEMKLLKTSLPPGIWVRGYEDRMDLYSVMIRGPERTPYEGGLFFFDFQLSANYPRAPPLCHYVTYCSDKLNPNLYEDGKVCVSLLGTWNGKGTEVWTSQSNLLQVIISIQGLILVSEPYFNEAGYERQKGTQQGRENSRMYNEMVVLKLIQAMSKVILNPPEIFREEIIKHFHQKAFCLVSQLEKWLLISENYNDKHPLSPTTPTTFRQISNTENNLDLPEYPLIPASKGFCITLRKTVENFRNTLRIAGITPCNTGSEKLYGISENVDTKSEDIFTHCT